MADTPLLDASAPSPRRRVAWALGLAWVGLHVLGMAAGGFHLEAEHAFLWGSAAPEAVLRHGALTPALIEQGEAQRLVTGAGYLGPGLLSLVLGLWIGLSSLAFLEQRVGALRLVFTLLTGAVAGGLARTALNAGSTLPHSAGWDVIMAAVGARIPWGLARGGPEGRTAVSSALAFAALSVGLVYLTNDGRLEPLRGQGVAFVVGALALGLLRPGGAGAPPGRVGKGLGLLALAAVALAVGVQVRQALAAPGRGPVAALLERLDAAEDAALSLWREGRDPGRVPRSEREALGERLDALLTDPALPGLPGESELRAFAQALRPLATGDLRDPSGVLARLKRAAAAWSPVERRLRAQNGLGEPDAAPWR